jgi:P-type Na+/K+ transporter
MWCLSSVNHAHTPLSIIYIPEVNHRVFQVDGLTWHWGLVFGQLVLYLVLAELYKLARREYIRRPALHDNPATRYEKRTGRRLHVANTMDPQQATSSPV